MLSWVYRKGVADILEQYRATSEATPVSTPRIEAKRVMNVVMPVMRRIQARAAQPLAAPGVAHTDEPVSHRLQQRLVE